MGVHVVTFRREKCASIPELFEWGSRKGKGSINLVLWLQGWVSYSFLWLVSPKEWQSQITTTSNNKHLGTFSLHHVILGDKWWKLGLVELWALAITILEKSDILSIITSKPIAPFLSILLGLNIQEYSASGIINILYVL